MDKNQIDKLKSEVSLKVIEDYLVKKVEGQNITKLGIGTGTTIYYVIEHLAKLDKNLTKDLLLVPTSYESMIHISKYNHLNLCSIEQFDNLDLYIDGADEIDKNLNLIKGAGAAHLKEKIVASMSSKFIVIGDYTKKSERLGQNWKKGIPVEVISYGLKYVIYKIENDFDFIICKVRYGNGKIGPVITDNGNIIIDLILKDDKTWSDYIDYSEFESKILNIPGVIEVGLFTNNICHKAYFCLENSKICIREKDGSEKII